MREPIAYGPGALGVPVVPELSGDGKISVAGRGRLPAPLPWCARAGGARVLSACKDTRVSTIWTPSGEHEPAGARPGAAGDPRPGPDGQPGEPTEEELAAIRQARAELASVPVADIIANHAVGLWELAILHLSPDPLPDGRPARPRMTEAGLAIDALAAMVDTLGDRLAPHDAMLRDTVTQLRLAFVQLTDALAALDERTAAEEAAGGADPGSAAGAL